MMLSVQLWTNQQTAYNVYQKYEKTMDFSSQN